MPTDKEKSTVDEVLGAVPDDLHLLVGDPLLLVAVVEASEEEAIEAHTGEYRCLLPGVSERVDLPGDPGLTAVAEFFHQVPVMIR